MIKWLKKRKEKRGLINKTVVNTFTKIWASRLMWLGTICILFPFFIVILNSYIQAESEMISALVHLAEIVTGSTFGAFAVYMARAFFDTKTEKEHELKKAQIELEETVNNESTEESEDNRDD